MNCTDRISDSKPDQPSVPRSPQNNFGERLTLYCNILKLRSHSPTLAIILSHLPPQYSWLAPACMISLVLNETLLENKPKRCVHST